MKRPTLGTTQASGYARVALANIRQEYPNKLDHVMNHAGEAHSPRELHPVFYGSYDWHSSVHMHWLLVRLMRLFPALPEVDKIAEVLDVHFTEAAIAQECAYLQQPSRQSFERTYGWAWLLKLQHELMLLKSVRAEAADWTEIVSPLATAFVRRYNAFLPIAQFPVRAGTHANSAFGLLFALEYARRTGEVELESLALKKAQEWFADDRVYPAEYEPAYDDFLSGGLMEAVLMRESSPDRFPEWWERFRPSPEGLSRWLQPVGVSDRRDPKLSHLDGLNLSRAWCWRKLQPCLQGDLGRSADHAIAAHLEAGLPHAGNGDYVGTHWLASFALLALTEE